MKQKLTAVATLDQKHNSALIRYIDTVLSEYASLKRKVYYIVRSGDYETPKLNAYLQRTYHITKRSANSIIKDAQGTYNALMALKKTERIQKLERIAVLNRQIEKLTTKRDKNKARLETLKYPPKALRQKQQRIRRKLVAKKARLNRIRQKFIILEEQIAGGRIAVCFGTKKLLKQEALPAFRDKRDSEIIFVGSKEETACNQMLQLTYNKQNNQFTIKLRKDGPAFKDADSDVKYVCGKVHFGYGYAKRKIIEALNDKTSPLSYRIVKRDDRYELHCTFEISTTKQDVVTRSAYGTVGLDFNQGFIALSETNGEGDLVHTDRIGYRFCEGNKTIDDLRQLAKQVTAYALTHGKDLVIEDLSFTKKKSKTTKAEKKKGRKYNRMLHSLPYHIFNEAVTTRCIKDRVYLHKVSPAWTSYIAKKKYCPKMKLNVHTGAAYVIARRGQGYKDKAS